MFKPIIVTDFRLMCLATLTICTLLLHSCHTSKMAIDKDGFIQIFNGKNLNNWIGDSTWWHVEDSSLVGIVTPATLLKRNSFIIWQGHMPQDFELRLQYMISDKGNSGINYRSEMIEGIPYALK